MNSITATPACEAATMPAAWSPAFVRSRVLDYVELTKPKIATMALITVAVGYFLGGAGDWAAGPFWNAILGITLVAASSSAWNQLLERKTDALMVRTQNRPLPAGRLQPRDAAAFALITGIVGIFYLAWTVNGLTALLAAATLIIYAFIYTPLKSRTGLNTVIGAIPGALPPVLGWTAAGGQLDAGAFALFAILFLWQFPHFLAIAWIYREEYARAGLRMLTVSSAATHTTGRLAVGYAAALIPVSLLPHHYGLAGTVYALIAVVLGGAYLGGALWFLRNPERRTARSLLWVSLVYLPALLLVLVGDHYRLLS